MNPRNCDQAMDWATREEVLYCGREERFSRRVQTFCESHLVPCPMDIKDPFLGVELTSHIHRVPMVLMCGSIPLLLHTSSWRDA
jgi:hypothetical protein